MAKTEIVADVNMDEMEMDEMESICCNGCGTNTDLYINHEITDCTGEQITCLPCAFKWQKDGRSY